MRRLQAVFSLVFALLAGSSAYAQATRTWVSGVGDDVNPCSRTAPCKTFAGAISKTTAGGEINVIDPGGFGALTITKSITIDGTPMLAGVLTSGTNGIVINASATDVVILRGLDINGAGTGLKGIYVVQAGKVIIEDCHIYGFSPRNISIEPASSPVVVEISRTKVNAGLSNGIVIQPGNASIKAQVTLNQAEVKGNVNYGISVTAGGSVTIRDSSIVDNGISAGLANLRVDGTGGAASADVDNTLLGGGGIGVFAVTGATVRISNSSIVDNATGILMSGGSVLSYGNNRVAGNTAGAGFSGSISLQ